LQRGRDAAGQRPRLRARAAVAAGVARARLGSDARRRPDPVRAGGPGQAGDRRRRAAPRLAAGGAPVGELRAGGGRGGCAPPRGGARPERGLAPLWERGGPVTAWIEGNHRSDPSTGGSPAVTLDGHLHWSHKNSYCSGPPPFRGAWLLALPERRL